MDSLTQITLGAAVGELVLGRKIGNKAMMWGAVAGTIPDLDVFARLWMNEIDSLAVHRGLSHSILFAVVAPFFLGYLTDRYYASGLHQRTGVRWANLVVWLLFYSLLVSGVLFLFKMQPHGGKRIHVSVASAIIGMKDMDSFVTLIWNTRTGRYSSIIPNYHADIMSDWMIFLSLPLCPISNVTG